MKKVDGEGRRAPDKDKIDKLWSEVVRLRAGYSCQLHGCGGRLCGDRMDAHHVFGRGMTVRWLLDNGLCVCKGHHLYYIHNGNTQAQAQEDQREILGSELYDYLDDLSRQDGKDSAPYRREVYAFLKAEKARLLAEAA